MNTYSIAPLISSVLFLLLGIFVLSKNRKAPTNIIFFFACLVTFIWQFTWFILFNTKDPSKAAYLVKIGYTGILFIPITFYHFTMNLLELRREKYLIAVSYIISTVFLVTLWASNSFINKYYIYFWGYYPKANILHPFYLLLLFMLAIRGIFILDRYAREKDTPPIKYNQARYLFWGFIFYTFAASDFLVNYGIEFYPIGFIFILAFLALTAYAIVAYQLMDIEVIIKKTLVYAGLFTFAFGVIVGVAMLTQELLSQFFAVSRLVSLAISAVIIIFSLRPLENFLVNTTNKFLFQKKYDPRKILKDFADEVLTILNLDRLCKVTIDTLVKNLYLTNCAVMLLSREEIGYEIYDSFGIEDKNIYFDTENNLIKHLRSTQSPLLYQSHDKNLQASDEIKKEMGKIKSQLCMPLIIHKDMVGILSLGAKKSDQSYNADDIDILTTLIKALSIAISNARLFMQAAQNEKLAAIGTITSAINHEVCSPLNNISVNMQGFMLEVDRGIYKNQDELLKKVKDMIQDTREKIHKATSITSKLSSFAKPRNIVESKPVSIARTVEDALDLLRHKLQLDKIGLEKNIPEDLSKILVDEDQMQQIFFNLIKNAAEAIKENGTITITAKEDDDKVKIEIKDTGCGIPEDKLDEIFKPFYTTKGGSKGSGYGLAVVKETVQRNNGEITVKSKVGKGTTFYLEFQKA